MREVTNHRGEQVVEGDPHLGTYRGVANQEHQCMRCERIIKPGEQFDEDFVMLCVACGDLYDLLDAQ